MIKCYSAQNIHSAEVEKFHSRTRSLNLGVLFNVLESMDGVEGIADHPTINCKILYVYTLSEEGLRFLSDFQVPQRLQSKLLSL